MIALWLFRSSPTLTANYQKAIVTSLFLFAMFGIFCNIRFTCFFACLANLAYQETHLITEPVTPKGRRTRTQILNATREVLAQTGYVSLRMADVAERAGLSMGALYRYFDNKEDLFDNLIGDIHEDLYRASYGGDHRLTENAYEALLCANRGYLAHYYENRDVLRALFEVMTVDTRFRDIWWRMRQRHIKRFMRAYRSTSASSEMSDIEALRRCEALSSMVEMSAYVWFAQEELNSQAISLDQAAETITDIWHGAFFRTGESAATLQVNNKRDAK